MVVFGSTHAEQASEPASPYLTINISKNPNSSLTEAVNTQNPTTTNVENVAPPSSLSRTSDLPNECGALVGMGPVADSQMDMSFSLDRAEEAMDAVKTWKSAVETINQPGTLSVQS
jgi:hypothetical protein